MTPTRANQKRQYRKRVAVWKLGKHCAYPGCPRVFQRMFDLDCHHSRGKLGPLLLDERYWIPLCRPHHDWVRDNPDAARDMGLLCEKGLWNTQ